MQSNWVHRRRGARIAAILASLALFSGQQCSRVVDRAVTAVEGSASSLLDKMGATGWRIHLHPKLIKAGSVVAAFSLTSTDIPEERLICPGRCLLFFIDTMPLHHFAHPTAIVLYDLDGKKVVDKPLQAEWWPTIDGRSVFNTVAERRRRDPRREWESGIVPPIPLDPPSSTLHYVAFKSIHRSSPGEGVWAVVVNGYDDPSDTFDEDTVGMYRVLQGFGIPDTNIGFLSPLDHSSQGITTTPVSLQALENALGNVGNPCNDFLLFYSAHGVTNNLACGTDPNHAVTSGLTPQQDYVSASELKKWLEANVSHCKNVTIVVEACKSGSILKFLRDGDASQNVAAFRSGAADDPWQMFVSASELEESAGDVDTALDKNVADAGSETIWGYVEAFGTRDADTDHNGKIDFKEAVDYAKKMDATGGNHTSEAYVSSSPGGLPVALQWVHGSNLVALGGQPKVVFDTLCAGTSPSTSSTCSNNVTRCCGATLKLTVSNDSTQPSSMPFALRLFRPDPAANWKPYYDASDNMRTTVMLPGLAGDAQYQVQIDLGKVPKSLKKGSTPTMQAIIDHLEKGGASPPLSGSAKDEMKLTVNQCVWDACCWLSSSLCP